MGNEYRPLSDFNEDELREYLHHTALQDMLYTLVKYGIRSMSMTPEGQALLDVFLPTLGFGEKGFKERLGTDSSEIRERLGMFYAMVLGKEYDPEHFEKGEDLFCMVVMHDLLYELKGSLQGQEKLSQQG